MVEDVEVGGGEVEKPKEEFEEIPTGSPTYVPGFKRVVSKISMAEQWIPREAKKFKDCITGTIEVL